jgi:hypothetical protein
VGAADVAISVRGGPPGEKVASVKVDAVTLRDEPEPSHLDEESRWYTEHAALVISTTKWAILGAAAGVCVGAATRAFLWCLAASTRWTGRLFTGAIRPYHLLPSPCPPASS